MSPRSETAGSDRHEDLSAGEVRVRPLQAGALKQDSGTISSNWTDIPGRNVMRDGQEVTIYNGAVTTLTGKRGTLTIRDRNEWVAVANEKVADGDFRPGIGIGTWKVVRGTGQYAGIVGKGRNGHVGLGFWRGMGVGDTIRVWIVPVSGTRLFIAAATRKDANEQEVKQIVESFCFVSVVVRTS